MEHLSSFPTMWVFNNVRAELYITLLFLSSSGTDSHCCSTEEGSGMLTWKSESGSLCPRNHSLLFPAGRGVKAQSHTSAWVHVTHFISDQKHRAVILEDCPNVISSSWAYGISGHITCIATYYRPDSYMYWNTSSHCFTGYWILRQLKGYALGSSNQAIVKLKLLHTSSMNPGEDLKLTYKDLTLSSHSHVWPPWAHFILSAAKLNENDATFTNLQYDSLDMQKGWFTSAFSVERASS